MKLELRCCACGVEQASMYVPWDETTVNASTWWTTLPCASCEADLRAEARDEGGRASYHDAVQQLPADLRTKVGDILNRGVDIELPPR